jgi:hypothetical protein
MDRNTETDQSRGDDKQRIEDDLVAMMLIVYCSFPRVVDEASSAKDRVAREADRLFGLATESFDSIPRTLSRSSFLRQMKGSRAFLKFF